MGRRRVGGPVGSGGRRAGSVGSINGAVGAGGVSCTVAWVARMHGYPPVSRRFGHKIAPAARCFCFPNRGAGPSDGAGGGVLTERSKTFRLGRDWPSWRASRSRRKGLLRKKEATRTSLPSNSCSTRLWGDMTRGSAQAPLPGTLRTRVSGNMRL